MKYENLFSYYYNGERPNYRNTGLFLLNDEIREIAIDGIDSEIKPFKELHIYPELYPDYIAYSQFMCLKCRAKYYLVEGECPTCKEITAVSSLLGIEILKQIRYLTFYNVNTFEKDNKVLLNTSDYEREKVLNSSKDLKPITIKNKETFSLIKKSIFTFDLKYEKDLSDELLDFIDSVKQNDKLCEAIIKHYCNEYNIACNSQDSAKFIKRIDIKSLFGYHSYHLDFSQENKISIIYGPNGLGKTTLFKIIDTLLGSKEEQELVSGFKSLIKVPFEKIDITFVDNTNLSLKKSFNGLIISYKSGREQTSEHKLNIKQKATEQELLNDVKSHIQYISKLFPKSINNKQRLLFVKTNRNKDPLALYNDIKNSVIKNKGNKKFDLTKMLDIAISKSLNPSFLNSFANQLSTITEQIRYSYQVIEENFGQNSLFEMDTFPVEKDFLNNYLDLVVSGFCPETISKLSIEKGDTKFNEEYHYRYKILATNLNVLSNFYHSFALFSDSFRTFYNVYDPSRKVIDVSKGQLILKNHLNERIGFDVLSSGEYNIATILYDVIFNTEKDSIVLIDEPEISLHLIWQQQIVETLLPIVEKRGNMQIIIASHSPFLAVGHDELLVDATIDEDTDEKL